MPNISLAKALKLKNRLAGRLNKVQQDIQMYNSVLEEQAGQVDVMALNKLRQEIVDALVSLKTKIILGNAKIQERIIRQGELKSQMAWLQGINTRHGKERHGYQNTEVVWVAAIQKADVDKQTKVLEAEIDAIQDALDAFNHEFQIEVAQRTLDLAS